MNLTYENGEVAPLDLTNSSLLRNVLVHNGSCLTSIAVESSPIITVTYRRCEFSLSPTEWQPFVEEDGVCLFKAVNQCVQATTPIVVVWNGDNVLPEMMIPIQDVFNNPSIMVMDVGESDGIEL